MLGFKVTEGCLTLLFGGNASGDLKLELMLVYRACFIKHE